MRLCRCGAIVKDRCVRCSPSIKHGKTTSERGYDWRWHQLSVRKRTCDPLCEWCLKDDVITAAEEVHHIVPIYEAPQLRLTWSNLMSVCKACHAMIEERGECRTVAE